MSTPPTRRRRRTALVARQTIGVGVQRRLAAVAVVIFALLLGIGYRAYSMQVVHTEHYRELADRQHLHAIEVPAPRGPIVDRRGVELAVTADADSIWANPRLVLDVASTAAVLAPVLDVPREVLLRRLSVERYFVWLRRHVATDVAAKIRALDLPGISVTREPRRFYPGKSLAGAVLGTADIDGRGLDGIELAMDDLLVGTRGHIRGIRDASGELMLPDPDAEAAAGATLTLTLDRTIQFVAERALERAVKAHQAASGIAIVLEIGTGDVLAMANYPEADPNRPDGAPMVTRNRAITDAFEIGSVMKVFSVAAALEAGVVTTETRFPIYGGRLRIPGGNVIKDSFHDTELTVAGIVKRSSNVGAVQIAQKLGRQALHDAFLRYRFGQKSGIELLGERAGLVRPAARWGPADLAVASYGYSMTATPMQALAAMAAIGDGGVYHAPRIVREVRAPSGEVLYERTADGEQIMRADIAAEMMVIMRSVFDRGRDGGTARAVVLDGFTAAGKTGTARKIDPSTGAYGSKYLSSFAGMAPSVSPRVAVLVIIDEPTGHAYYGSEVAGPAFAEIAGGALKVLGVPSEMSAVAAPAPVVESESDEGDDAEASVPEAEARTAAPGDVDLPGFRGMTIRAALGRAAKLGVVLEVRGSGVAVSQSVTPGPVAPGTLCVVEFR